MNIRKFFHHKQNNKTFNNTAVGAYPVALTDLEKNFLIKSISDSKYYLEFGSGGSTFLALTQTDIPFVVSVESDMDWLNHLRKWNCIVDNEKSNRLCFLHVNIGKTGNWGVPTEMDKKDLFPNYSMAPFATDKKTKFDAIFIDGRFRVACTMQAILNSDKNTKILMHDYTARPHYHVILQFLDIVDVIDTMVLFKLKDNISKKSVLDMYDKYKYDFA